ncbi:hypothetical protein B0T26DRAFT_799282 [Lasiosphaeria miniovina]|uniref:DUF6546 domain-containing protein n=1 Tax=Lasiosphaeria miniovina TaxID=1954250 RepID=A0AA40B3W9_9PEZI|nr:uncharacterized protein B0T26DRAFT_799282 [Lasiosphaeria miniovina]KAK0727211.1 hypothetical protein B0T26DRAFT_799282 [Lasiosphaeria miniovina]
MSETMALWGVLPAELRLMILEIVADDFTFRSDKKARAGYATVCREWQYFFEPFNFEHLVFDQTRINQFARHVGNGEAERAMRRQTYVKAISFRVKLDNYKCKTCRLEETQIIMGKNRSTFTRAILRLLAILSNWPQIIPSYRKGITLDIGVYSPSDCRHQFRDFHLDEVYPMQEVRDVFADPLWEAYTEHKARRGLATLDDSHHSWSNGQRSYIPLTSRLRLTREMSLSFNLPQFKSSQTLPQVPAVDELVIRRQFYWQIAPDTLRKLLESFTCLVSFRHEGWQRPTMARQQDFVKAYKTLISRGLPVSLRNLHLFQDSNRDLNPSIVPQIVITPNRGLGKTLARASKSLEVLSAAFVVDAIDFFDGFCPLTAPKTLEPPAPWENLHNLILTAKMLHPKMSMRHAHPPLLLAAGHAAAFMPKLVLMQLWNGGEGNACIYQYTWKSESGTATLWLSANSLLKSVRSILDNGSPVYNTWSESLRKTRGLPYGDLKTGADRIQRKPSDIKTCVVAATHSHGGRHVLWHVLHPIS